MVYINKEKDEDCKDSVFLHRKQFRIQKWRKNQKGGFSASTLNHQRRTRFSYCQIYKRYNMGSFSSRKKKEEKVKEISAQPSSVFDHSLDPPHKLSIRQPSSVLTRKKVNLSFKQISEAKKRAIQKSPMVSDLLRAENWIIEPEVIEHLRIMNAFEYVEESPALAIHLYLIGSFSSLICNPKGLLKAKEGHNSKNNCQKKELYNEYAVIYADLFNIAFSNLLKIKIKGLPKQSDETIVSLEPLTKLHAPFLEQLTADGHPITNARFLRRCHWPNLFKLSLRDNAIIDSRQLGVAIVSITNSCHLQALDLSGLYSSKWGQISWILKLGFCDASLEGQKLQNDERYNKLYNGKVLQRVDCSITKNKLVRTHLRMVKQKFNTRYFDNPIAIW